MHMYKIDVQEEDTNELITNRMNSVEKGEIDLICKLSPGSNEGSDFVATRDYDDSILSLTTNNNKKIWGPKAHHADSTNNNPHLGPSEALFNITSIANNKIAKQINRSKDDTRTFSTDSYKREENIEERDPPDEKISEQHDLPSRAPHNDETTSWSRSSLMEVSSSNYDGTSKPSKQRQQASFVVHPRYVDPYPSSPTTRQLGHGDRTDRGTSACSTGLSRTEKLYNLSIAKQEQGRKRRDAIALASYRRSYVPDAEDFGFLPLARASDMYYKGMRILRKKNAWIVKEQEKRRAKGESAQYDNYSQSFASISSPNLLMQRQFVSPQTSKKLSSSRLNDMYKRSLRFIHEKHVRIEALHTSLERDLRSKLPQKKMPMSRANEMYKKSLRSLFERNKRIAQHAANIERNRVSFSLKLPASRSVNMYERSIKYIGAKHKRIHQVKKAKQQEIEQAREDLGRMCISRASHVYLRGMQYLHAKEEKLTKLREDEEEDVSQQYKKATSPPFDTSATTMYTKRETRESVRADTVKQVVGDYLNKKKFWLRPSEALFLAEHLTEGPIGKAIPAANISTTNCGFLETTDHYPVQGKEEKSIDMTMTANNATLVVGGRVGSPLGVLCVTRHENKENLIRIKCQRLAMCPL